MEKLQSSAGFLLCNACGTQYPVTTPSNKDSCKICDNPRQFVPPEGQTFTTLVTLRNQGHRNVWWQDKQNPKIWSVRTEPQFAIGERAMLLQTEAGNILWDLIPFLDPETVDRIYDFGGLKAIVISHPHYYSTWADWSRTFSCPVYTCGFLTDIYTPLLHPESGVTAILAGGHFPGSLLLHWKQAKSLFIADTIFTSPSATNPVPGKEGVISFTFFWSIPNRIPLHPDDILMIWNKVKHLEFDSAYGAFKGMDVYTMSNEAGRGTGGVKGRLLQSCKIYVGAMGWREHGVWDQILEVS
ncbi:hypothetical protein LTR86_003259 [Recurvomyces mirabilis]|nr:hypothetical protein LTR86_003259 [Recurvomyces mirabilis]